ncbi:hypothetical protein [Acetobacter vaccinii]|uniref:Uncharacterized protein n=1 Tax=Acetobacter vaccinii TaxID=2592655 RepID=A0A5C1YRA9_9PROT|nr:hypothetical protein [Acetobacter vaccinii]QEO18886.1 hypothetical protein FLP30_13475 [Acetobacter vaccinii]
MAFSTPAAPGAAPMTRAEMIAWCQAQARRAGITRPVPTAHDLYAEFCNDWWKKRGRTPPGQDAPAPGVQKE